MLFRKLNSGKEGVTGRERQVENEKGGGSIKQLRYSPDGRELELYYPPSKRGVKLSYSTLEQEKAEIKSSLSCSHPAGSILFCFADAS